MIQQKLVRLATPTEIKKLSNEVKPKATRKTTSKKKISGTSSIESKVSKLKGKYINIYMLGRKEPLSNIIQSATLSSPNYTIRTLTINTNTGTERIAVKYKCIGK